MICSICKQPIPVKGTWAEGNNAEPVVKKGRCCDDCDWKVVIPARLRLLKAERQGRRGKSKDSA